MITSVIPHIAVLTCHPDTQSQAVHGIEAGVWQTPHGGLALTYALRGDSTRLRIPPPRPPRRGDRLWQHTCFECFISVKGGPAYYEFNFAPSGEWAAYAFRRYREEAPLARGEIAPNMAVHETAEGLELDALVRLDRLFDIQPRAGLRLALCAVIEEEPGILSYWALKHPPGKPDFHLPDAFALELEPPEAEAVRKPAMGKQ